MAHVARWIIAGSAAAVGACGGNAPPAPASPPAPAPASATSPPPADEATASDAASSSPFAHVPRPPGPDAPKEVADDRFLIAKSLMRAERFDQAELALRTIAKERPADARIAFFLGLAVHKQKRYADAKPYFEGVLRAGQSFAEIDYVFHFLGWCHYYLGELTDARAAFEEHLRRVPAEADSVFALGVIAFDEDRIDDAEQRFRQAIAMQESVPRAARDVAKAHARLGDVLMRRERLGDAERELREAVRLYPDHYEAWAKLARVLDRQGRPEEAAAARAEDEARRTPSATSR